MSNEIKRNIPAGLIVGGIVAFLAWLLFPLLLLYYSDSNAIAGQIGDTFGAVNSLFTAAAFLLLIYTANMQRQELELQREELRLTREELANSVTQQKELVSITKEGYELQKSLSMDKILPSFEITGIKHDNSNFEGRLLVLDLILLNQAAKIVGHKTIINNEECYTENLTTLLSIGTKTGIIIKDKATRELENFTLTVYFVNLSGMNIKQIFYLNNSKIEKSIPMLADSYEHSYFNPGSFNVVSLS